MVVLGGVVVSLLLSFTIRSVTDAYAVSAENMKMNSTLSLPLSSPVAGTEGLSVCLYHHVVNAGKEGVLFRYGNGTKRDHFVWVRALFWKFSFGNLEHVDIQS